MKAVDWLEDQELHELAGPYKPAYNKKIEWDSLIQEKEKCRDNNSLQIYRELLQRGQEQTVLHGQWAGQKVAARNIRLNIRKALNNIISKDSSRLPGEMVRVSIIRGISID